VPRAQITFNDVSVTQPTTTFNTLTNTWETRLPGGPLSGNTFLSGLAFPVPAGGLAGGINPVTWSGVFATDSPGVSLNWQWAAAVYTSFSTNYRTTGVKPVDVSTPQYPNADHAGTPETFKSSVTGGARGGGGANFTGSLSGTESAALVCPVARALSASSVLTLRSDHTLRRYSRIERLR